MSQSEAGELRRRAQRLRRLASRIEVGLVMSLDRHAGSDTWSGPRPLFCTNLLRRDQANLHAEVEGLLSHAWLLDQRATHLDLTAALRPEGAS